MVKHAPSKHVTRVRFSYPVPISNNVACPSLVKGTPLGTECEQHGAVCRGFESHRGDQFQKSKSSAEEYGYFTINETATVFACCLEYATLGDR